jgi:glucose-1-phosphatase
MRPQALLFDLGGVLIDIDFGRAIRSWAECAQQDVELLRPRFSFNEWYAKHECGQITAIEYFASLRKTLDIDLTDEEFERGWNSIFVGEIAVTSNLLSTLRGSIPLYAFTNSNVLHQSVLNRSYKHIVDLFDGIYVSSSLGLRKPQPEAFLAVARDMRVVPPSIAFFDDLLENVAGAERAGLAAFHVPSPDAVLRHLHELGVC